MTRLTGDEKHSAAATSTLDVLRVLYERVLKVSPESVGDLARDRFYLSKGHGPMAYYAVLAEQGYFPESWLTDWGSYDSPLGFHPDRNLVPGWRSGPARSVTGCRWRSVRRSACAPRACRPGGGPGR